MLEDRGLEFSIREKVSLEQMVSKKEMKLVHEQQCVTLMHPIFSSVCLQSYVGSDAVTNS
jgi:hypothetical protein